MKLGHKRTNSVKSEEFTINKDEICKNIKEIQGLLRISKYIEDLNVIFGNPDQRN